MRRVLGDARGQSRLGRAARGAVLASPLVTVLILLSSAPATVWPKEDPMTQHTSHRYQEQSFDNLRGLDGISDAQVAEHLALYAGYVKQVNALNEQLAELRSHGRASGRDAEFAELTRRLGFEYDGMILHEYYFSNLRAGAEPRPATNSEVAQALTQSFGSVEQWRNDFHAVGGMRGIGWVLLCQDPVTHLLTNHWITLHQDGVPAG